MIHLSEKGAQASSPLYLNSPDSTPTTLSALNDKIQAQFQRAVSNASDYSISLGYNGLVTYVTVNPEEGPECLQPHDVMLRLTESSEKMVYLGNVIPFSGSADDLNAIVKNNMNSDFTPVFTLHYDDLTNRIYDHGDSGCTIS